MKSSPLRVTSYEDADFVFVPVCLGHAILLGVFLDWCVADWFSSLPKMPKCCGLGEKKSP